MLATTQVPRFWATALATVAVIQRFAVTTMDHSRVRRRAHTHTLSKRILANSIHWYIVFLNSGFDHSGHCLLPNSSRGIKSEDLDSTRLNLGPFLNCRFG